MTTLFTFILFLIPLAALLTRIISIMQNAEDRSFYASEALREIIITTVLFTLLGPVAGLLVIALPFAFIAPPTLDGLLLFVIGSFAMGVVPACLTGLSVGALLPWLRARDEAWSAAWIGALMAVIFALSNNRSYDGAKLILASACGAFAGFVVAKLNARLNH